MCPVRRNEDKPVKKNNRAQSAIAVLAVQTSLRKRRLPSSRPKQNVTNDEIAAGNTGSVPASPPHPP